MTVRAAKIFTPLPLYLNRTTNIAVSTTMPLTFHEALRKSNSAKEILRKLSSAKSRTVPDVPWDPAYNECKHIFGTFILPSMLHLLAFFIGFYLYRIREHEGLYVLMEKVCIVPSNFTWLRFGKILHRFHKYSINRLN